MNDGKIITRGLTKHYDKQVAANSVDLDIADGEVFALLGPNGAGKSTVVKMLTTILGMDTGHAYVGGFNVQYEPEKVRRHIGVALQDIGLDPLMTATEMLVLQALAFGMSRKAARTKAAELLKIVGLDDVPPKKRSGAYSGGMKRRLDLALALVHSPRVLFLDEPTTGLDPASRTAVWNEVKKLNSEDGMTIFLTTQYLEEADKLADRIAIMNQGMLVAEGTPDDLKKHVGEEKIEVRFDSAGDAGRGYALLDGKLRTSISGSELQCFTQNSSGSVPEIVRLLDENGIPVAGINVSKPSLDDVFLKLTGEQIQVESTEAA